MAIKAGNRAGDHYTVDQIFWGLVVLLVIWFFIVLMTGSLYQ
jgi:hypothetical protein